MNDANEAQAGDQSGIATSSSPAGYAFFNHSTSTLPNQLPPNVDNKPLARQKRKRTSVEDQAVLETAYKHDPKPDKAARLEIVKNVALGEKEVQIWFQNRRQSSRRKARPLLPHEVAQYQASRANMAQSGEPAAEGAALGSDDTIPDDSLLERSDDAAPQHTGPVIHPGPPSREPHRIGEAVYAQDEERSGETQPALMALQALQSTASSQPASQSFVPSSSAGFGYLANKRRGSSFRTDEEQPVPVNSQEESTGAEPQRRLRKSISYVRLSMTSEGAAKVITKDSSSPSPPRPSQESRQSFSASQGSAVPLNLTPGSTNIPARPLKRSASGRSRDSRAWEFWCDRDSRTELEDKAEKDASGSAADAIGLMRANSGRRVLGAVPSKRNSLLTRQTSAKRSKHEHSRPPLQRSHTSSGRLQQASAIKHTPQLKYSDSGASISVPGNDSDKENWTPDREYHPSSQLTTMPAPSGKSSRPVLGEKPTAGNMMRQGRGQRASGKPIALRAGHGENADPEADPELAAFMQKQRKSNSISEDEELDCVQGLLSLSQGNWR